MSTTYSRGQTSLAREVVSERLKKWALSFLGFVISKDPIYEETVH